MLNSCVFLISLTVYFTENIRAGWLILERRVSVRVHGNDVYNESRLGSTGRIDWLTRPGGERRPIIQRGTRWNVKSRTVPIGAQCVYIEHQVYTTTNDDKAMSSFNHRRSLDSVGPPATLPGRTDGLATIGLINGRDREGQRPRNIEPTNTNATCSI